MERRPQRENRTKGKGAVQTLASRLDRARSWAGTCRPPAAHWPSGSRKAAVVMILVGQYDSPFVRRVAITLHLYGMRFRRNAFSVFGDAKEMAKINPIVRIPSLILDDGGVLIDSGAIIDYLDGLAGPERALTPASGAERQMVLQVMAHATGAIDKLGTIVYERTFHPPEHVAQDWIARCRSQLEGALSVLEELPK